jgi:ribosomal protein L30E
MQGTIYAANMPHRSFRNINIYKNLSKLLILNYNIKWLNLGHTR